jgi:membrane-associated protein
MNQILTTLLSLVLLYGYPIVLGVVLAGELGFPIPVTSILLAAGSFTVDNTLNIFWLVPLVAVTAIIGDSIGYWFGRRYGRFLIEKYLPRIGLTGKKVETIEQFLQRWGVWFIFFSRWLVTPLGVPLNIVAGIGKYPFLRFLVFAALGECIWASVYVYLGYLFGANWITLVTYISNAPWIFALFTVAVFSFLIASHIRKLIQ